MRPRSPQSRWFLCCVFIALAAPEPLALFAGKTMGQRLVAEELDAGRIWVVRSFLSPNECGEFIRLSESHTYETGLVAGQVLASVRNNDRVILDDPALATRLFERASSFLPKEVEDDVISGFNERFRFYRYQPGQTFKVHRDGSFMRMMPCEFSRVTFMVYLNEQLSGGETRFFAGMREAMDREAFLTVRPETGMALIFRHDIFHEGSVVTKGTKYVLRTDVMYRPR
jgi:prolyl 4-hydroxylase